MIKRLTVLLLWALPTMAQGSLHRGEVDGNPPHGAAAESIALREARESRAQGYTCRNFAYVRCIDAENSAGWSGQDWGAWVNAADKDLGSDAGEIWVAVPGQSSKTAIAISTNHVLRFVQGGTYTVFAGITIGATGGIVGEPAGSAPNNTSAPVILKQASGANLGVLVTMGQQSFLRDVTIDGNNAGNTNTVCVQVTGIRTDFQGVNVANCPSHGIQLGTSGTNVAAAAKLHKVMVNFSGGSGLYILNSADHMINESEFENSGRYGIESSNSATVRMVNSDIGGNAMGGINATCSRKGPINAVGWMITNNQFGSNRGNDLSATGAGPPYCLYGWTIVGNSFLGPPPATQDDTIDAIHLDSGGRHTISGNFIYNQGQRYRYMVGIFSTNAAELADVIGLNVMDGNGIGHAVIHPAPTTWFGFNQEMGLQGRTNLVRLSEGAAPSGGGGLDTCYGDFAEHAMKCSYNNGRFFPVTQTIASGTVRLGGSRIEAGGCAASASVAVAGIEATDRIVWSYAGAPSVEVGRLTVSPYVDSGAVNFLVCNGTGGGLSVGGTAINWSVVR